MDVRVKKVPEVGVGSGRDQWKTSKTGVLFEVRDDDGALRGRFQVSTGGVRWWRRSAQNATRFVTWGELVSYLEDR